MSEGSATEICQLILNLDFRALWHCIIVFGRILFELFLLGAAPNSHHFYHEQPEELRETVEAHRPLPSTPLKPFAPPPLRSPVYLYLYLYLYLCFDHLTPKYDFPNLHL